MQYVCIVFYVKRRSLAVQTGLRDTLRLFLLRPHAGTQPIRPTCTPASLCVVFNVNFQVFLSISVYSTFYIVKYIAFNVNSIGFSYS